MYAEGSLQYAYRLRHLGHPSEFVCKDICALWRAKADRLHMLFGMTELLSALLSWWAANKGLDHCGPYKAFPALEMLRNTGLSITTIQ